MLNRLSRIIVAIFVLGLIGCGGGGGSVDGRGLGTEGTGFKTLMRGKVVTAAGTAVSGVNISTDDAATTTNNIGEFSLETFVSQNEAISLNVEVGAVSESVSLAPVTISPNETVEVTLEANEAAGTVLIQSQQVVPNLPTVEEINQSSDSVVSSINQGNEISIHDPNSSSLQEENMLDPDFVDL